MKRVSLQGYVIGIIGLAVGLVLGILLCLSFLRTIWTDFHPDFFFFFSILSTVFGAVSLVVTLVQGVKARGERRTHKAQITTWIENSKGILSSLSRLQDLEFSKMADLKNSIRILETSVSSFMQSLHRANSINTEFSDKDDEKFAKAAALKSYAHLTESTQGNKKGIKSYTPNKETPPLKDESATEVQ